MNHSTSAGVPPVPTAGDATVAGVDVVRDAGRLGGKIGYMSEGFTLYGALSVEENLDFFARLYNVPPDVAAARKEKLLRFAWLEEARHRPVEHLSRMGPAGQHDDSSSWRQLVSTSPE